MVDNKMCIGVINDDLMARINPEKEEELLSKDGGSSYGFYKATDAWLFVTSIQRFI